MAIEWTFKFDKKVKGSSKSLGEVKIDSFPSTAEEFEAKGNSLIDCAQSDCERRFRNAVNQGIASGDIKSEQDVQRKWKEWQMGGSQLPEEVRKDRDALAKLTNAMLTTKDPAYRKELAEKRAELEAKLFATIDI